MMKKHLNLMLVGVCSLVFSFLLTSYAIADTIFDYGSYWKYYQASGSDLTWAWHEAGTGVEAATYGSFDWSKMSTAPSGQGPFGLNLYDTYAHFPTTWDLNSGLALEKTVTINGTISNATLYFEIDNGIAIFINGTKVFGQNFENALGTGTLDISSALFHAGNNVIDILAEDHGGQNMVDLKLTGDVTSQSAVPAPATILLLGPGFAGLAALRKRFAK